MIKKLVIASTLAFLPCAVFADWWSASKIEAYVVTLNTTTFTSIGITGANSVQLYNPGAYDIKIASASTSPAAAKFTVKAASYLPAPINYNGVIYAIATDTNSLSIECLVIK